MCKLLASSSLVQVAITTGDVNGIGLEVTSKALNQIGPKRGVQFCLFRSEKCKKKYLHLIDKKFQRITLSSLEESLLKKKSSLSSYKKILDISSSLPPPVWVHQSVKACLKKKIKALVTGPLSKESFYKAGYSTIGHTEALKKWTGTKNLFMAFIGNKCSVLLATGHLPLSEIPKKINASVLEKALFAAHKLRQVFKEDKKRKKPVALIGLNPHAGENGIIGKEEKLFFHKVIKKVEKKLSLLPSVNRRNPLFYGPLVPDAAFLPSNIKKYSVLVSPYHDQGLIGFKTLHGYDSGVHVTMGLPFIRTSVSHGTALDISNKNEANPGSMQRALLTALHLLNRPKASSI